MRTVFANAIAAAASIGFTVLAVAASAPAAAAATVDPVASAVVQTADLDLTSAAGHCTAMQRIDTAAERVCNVTPGDKLGAASCRMRAVADASQALDRIGAPERIATR